jgi:hypothetical protein
MNRGIVVQKQDLIGDLPSKCPSITPEELRNTPGIDILALCKIINEEDAVLIPKNRGKARTFAADFCTRNFWGRSKPLCRHSIDCCFVSGAHCI